MCATMKPTTVEQRRAVFRIQREFDEGAGLNFERTPTALLERETALQNTEEKIWDVLGDAGFAAWLLGRNDGSEPFRGDLAKAVELWRIKTDFKLQELKIRADAGMPDEQKQIQRTSLVLHTEARLAAVVGREALEKDILRVFLFLHVP